MYVFHTLCLTLDCAAYLVELPYNRSINRPVFVVRIEPKMYVNFCIKPGRKWDDTITMKQTRIDIDSVKLCTIGRGCLE